MKNETLVYSIGAVVVIISAVLKILHLPYAQYSNVMQMITLTMMFFFQAWHIAQLKKRIKEIEGK